MRDEGLYVIRTPWVIALVVMAGCSSPPTTDPDAATGPDAHVEVDARMADDASGARDVGVAMDTGCTTELTAAECSDGRDDDCDGTIDCADLACTTFSFCSTADSGADAGMDVGAASIDGGLLDAGTDGGTSPSDGGIDGGPPAPSVAATWVFPAMVPRGAETVFPTYLAHLLGRPVTHPIEMQTACASLTKASGPDEVVHLSVMFPGYGATTTQDVTMHAGTPQRVCLNPVYNFDALYALRSEIPGRIEASARDSAARDIGSAMQPVTILSANDMVWADGTVPFDDMRDLATVYSVPHDTQVEAVLPSVQMRSVFPGGFGASPYVRPLYNRSNSIARSTWVAEDVFLEPGESFGWLLRSVAGGTTNDLDVYLFTASQYTAWAGGTGTAATATWPAQTTGATAAYTSTGGGWYVFVLFNTPANFVSRSVTWTRDNTREDVARDALAAIYNELRARGTTYVNITTSYFALTQHVRRASEVLATGGANCIDGSLLFASLLELIGMQPVVIFKTGHAYVGVRSGPGSSYVWPIETTMVGSDTFVNAYNTAISNRVTDAASGDRSAKPG